MPGSDYEEALRRMDRTRDALRGLLRHLRPDPDEKDAGREQRRRWILGRLHRGCGEAHMAVELALKSLIHLGSDPARPAWGHDIGKLCAQLAEPHRSALPALLEPLGADAITPWHTDAVYHRAGRDPEATPELLAELARTACRVVSYTADQFPAGAAVAVLAYVELIEDYLDGYALDTGEPLR